MAELLGFAGQSRASGREAKEVGRASAPRLMGTSSKFLVAKIQKIRSLWRWMTDGCREIDATIRRMCVRMRFQTDVASSKIVFAKGKRNLTVTYMGDCW